MNRNLYLLGLIPLGVFYYLNSRQADGGSILYTCISKVFFYFGNKLVYRHTWNESGTFWGDPDGKCQEKSFDVTICDQEGPMGNVTKESQKSVLTQIFIDKWRAIRHTLSESTKQFSLLTRQKITLPNPNQRLDSVKDKPTVRYYCRGRE